MKRTNLQTVLDRIMKGVASSNEVNLFDKFIYATQQEGKEISHDAKSKIWENVKGKTIDKRVRRLHIAPVWKVAASITLIIGVVMIVHLSSSKPEINYLTKSTTRGQKATITLSDGSVVKLNAESSITYPESFAEVAKRDITLTGEAFFEVKRDEAKPFTIQTEGLLTTVLGTSFNITAFPDMDEIEVTVATGKVSVSPFQGESPFKPGRRFEGCDGCEQEGDVIQNPKSTIELTPGQQATYHKSSHELSMREVDTERYLAWKEGVIYLFDITLLEASKILTKWYNVEFQFSGEGIKNCKIDGKFKNDQLVNVLENIQFVIDFQFEIIDGDVVVIKGKGCN